MSPAACGLQVTSYTLNDEKMTWPTKQSLSDFARRSSTPLANIIISDYFDMLWPRFNELKKRVSEVARSAQYELVALHNKLSNYRKSFANGSDFVR